MTSSSARNATAVLVLLLIAFIFVPGIPKFWVTLGCYIGLFSLTTIGLVLLTGVGGMTSFGQATFVGFGAYTAAIVSQYYGFSPWIGLPAALLVTGVAALLVGAVTVRLAGHFLPVGTIAWSVALFYVFGNSAWLGAYNGLSGLPPLSIGSMDLIEPERFYIFLWLVVGLVLIATFNVLDSRTGRAIRALRFGSIAAASFGVKVFTVKLVVFVYAALLAGLSGWLFAHFQRAIAPSGFGLNAGIEYLLMAVVGGAGNLFGAIIGATVVTVAKDQLQNILPILLGRSGNFETIVFGSVLVLTLQLAPQGLWTLMRPWMPANQRPAVAPRQMPSRQRDTPADGKVLLEVKNISKAFGGLQALNLVSLRADAGQIVALIGPNGAGKSTLFNVMTGILSPDSGQVIFRGIETTRTTPQQAAALGIARTFQHVQLVPDMTAIENVALGSHLRTQTGLIRAATRLNSHEEQQIFADAQFQLDRVGLGHAANVEANALSLGDARIVEIARALAADPMLLLLDEPAAGLRYQEKQALAQLLRNIRNQGVAVLIVEHDMDFIMGLADHLVVLNFGTKIAEGQASVIRKDKVVIDAYLGGGP